MNRRLLSPIGGAILFAVLVAFVLGGLAWVTLQSLGLESDQRLASARADQAHVERLALWRLDSRLFPAWGVENNRPYAHYFPLHTPISLVWQAKTDALGDPALVPSPLLMAELPNWMTLHVQLDPETGWDSPQVMSGEIEAKFNDQLIDLYESPSNNLNGARSQALADLRQHFPAGKSYAQLLTCERVNPDDSPLGGVPFEVSPPKVAPMANSVGLAGGLGALGAMAEKADRGRDSLLTEPKPGRANSPNDALTNKEKTIEAMPPGAAVPLPPPAIGIVINNAGRAASNLNPVQQSATGGFNERNAAGKVAIDGVRAKTDNSIANPAMNPPGGYGAQPGGASRGGMPAAPQAVKKTEPAPQSKTADGGDPAKKSESGDAGKDTLTRGESVKSAPPVNGLTQADPMSLGAGLPAAAGAAAPVTETAATPQNAMKIASDANPSKLNDEQKSSEAESLRKQQDTNRDTLPHQDPDGRSNDPAVRGNADTRRSLSSSLRAPAVHLGPMRTLWITGESGQKALLLVRAARLESKVVFQGVLLDWLTLQKVLLDEVLPQLPDATLTPVESDTEADDRRMSALPVSLDPGPEPTPPSAGATPLRIGLALGWLAALAALAATGFVGWTLIDLSERRIRFVSAVTHELRTPLTSLRLYLDLLTSGMIRDEEQQKEYLLTLHRESERLNRLIENVLDFAKLEKRTVQAHKVPTALADLLDTVVLAWSDRMTSEGRELITTSTLPTGQMLTTDIRMAAQILGNLIDNARKYAASAVDRRVWIAAKPGDCGHIIIDVEDRGPGVAASERAGIFKPFRRGETADTTAGGAGLGLALARQWAEMLGGRLSYRVADGGIGACFRLELPV
jgi:signal transduction histidine kinase